jgi:uncharacterized membrane protein YgcG
LLVVLALLLVELWPAPAMAQARTLSWRELVVTARLDARGDLHVSERQQMVFTGDWNGGERSFRLESDQSLELTGLTRLSSSGTRIPLVEGKLSELDQYAWQDDSVLRWRSRRVYDPPFQQTEIGYVLEYRLSNVLEELGRSRYKLDHEFAFQFRPGTIERFRLHLTLDPIWLSERASPIVEEAGPLLPSQGFVLTLPLVYYGDELPTASWGEVLQRRTLRGTLLRGGLALGLLGLVAAAFLLLLWHLRRRGFFARLLGPSEVDPGFIVRHVLPLKPEVVAYLRDAGAGNRHVAALLARLERERKIRTWVREVPGPHGPRQNLELELLVPRAAFVDSERALIDQLFIHGDLTSTAAIDAYYTKTGFDPGADLGEALKLELVPLLGPSYGPQGGYTRWRRWIPVGLLVVLNIYVAAFAGENSANGRTWPAILATMACFFYFILNPYFARDLLASHVSPRRAAKWFAFGVGFETSSFVAMLLGASGLPVVGSVFLAAIGLIMIMIMLRAAWSRDHAAGMALRKRLEAARGYFAAELEKAAPALEKAWYPYLVAFDLSKAYDERLLGVAAEGSERQGSRRYSASFSSSSDRGGISSSSGSSSSGSEYVGGGGSFAGGGASGSWTSAVTALAAGVSKPGSGSSSSGSSSSSSSGGSRSGGGGGGGW